jgi:hypothetical protein
VSEDKEIPGGYFLNKGLMTFFKEDQKRLSEDRRSSERLSCLCSVLKYNCAKSGGSIPEYGQFWSLSMEGEEGPERGMKVKW